MPDHQYRRWIFIEAVHHPARRGTAADYRIERDADDPADIDEVFLSPLGCLWLLRKHAGGAQACPASMRPAMPAAQSAAELGGAGVLIRDRFVAPSRIHALLDCVRARNLGEFAPAGSAGVALQRREEIRGDLPVGRKDLYFAEQVSSVARGTGLEFEPRGLPRIVRIEPHHAWYPPGAGYSRHVDQPRGTTQRLVDGAVPECGLGPLRAAHFGFTIRGM